MSTNYEQFAPRRYPSWEEIGHTGGPADAGQDYVSLDQDQLFWADKNQREQALDLTAKQNAATSEELMPPSPEVMGLMYVEAEATNVAYDAMVDEAWARNAAYNIAAEDSMWREARAMNDAFDRRANRLGAIGVLAYLHPDITSRQEAVERRIAFENRTTSALDYLKSFAKETIGARWLQVGRALGKLATGGITVAPAEPVAETAPTAVAFTTASDDIIAAEIRGFYSEEELERIRHAVRVTRESEPTGSRQ